MSKFHKIAFTPNVKAVQSEFGTRSIYERSDSAKEVRAELTGAEFDFIEQRDGFYLATAGETGWPYVQYRGGPRGFLKVIDARTVGYADFRGNRQYISVGNLRGNDKAALFLMDYANRRRLKILARARVDDDPELIRSLRHEDYKAKIERAVILDVEAFDWNCPQHITPRYTMDEVEAMVRPVYEHIEKLEKEIELLKRGTDESIS
ncbi:MAG TPA: pyridoxamine 5'-phosphate oxidase family protein [Pyrinomonadaceae bacterium]|nr:pyridoxamine 5'-phosphate oxidase family protein [Pyrinomonadaceae bacterium]